MKDPSASVRYLGFRSTPGGGRQLDFTFTGPGASTESITVKISSDLLVGPDHMTLQECAAICFETLKGRLVGGNAGLPSSIKLTPEDISQHRKLGKTPGRR